MKVIHFGIHNKENKNSGDTLLFQTTRDLFDLHFNNIDWTLKNLWEPVDGETIDLINGEMDCILIGGGGLFLKDQKGAEESVSGWQWNCDTEAVRKIKKPIIIFGVGYNRFRNQEDFDPIFTENLKALAEGCIFFGLRNTGSIENIKRYIGEENPFFLQACPTTVLSKIYDRIQIENSEKILSFNLSYDRPKYRFGDREKEILEDLASFLRYAHENSDYNIHITLHKHIDGEILKYLPDNLTFELINLTESSANEIMEYYSKIDLAVGMRGHAQLIPFGLNKKMISIVSHNKMQYFLDDIKLNLGADVESSSFLDDLISKFNEVKDSASILNVLIQEQNRIWEATSSNFEYIRQKLSPKN
ncbi:MAG: polysaccharide pyruvyl transferase family protein [Cyclobacteriaceae bacterium]